MLQKAKQKWEDDGERFSADDDDTPRPTHTPRILDVRTGRVTYVVGIVYVEMKLKPDVLADLTREVSRNARHKSNYEVAILPLFLS